MKRDLKRLQPKHHAVIRLAFEGWPNTRIAAQVGIRRETVSRILNSPPAQAELARMQAEADELVTNVPLRTWLLNRLDSAATTEEAIKHARQLCGDWRGAMMRATRT